VFLFGVLLVWAEGTIICHLEPGKPLSRFSSEQLELLEKLNHADSVHLARLTRLVVPNRWDMDELLYSPMPHVVPHLSQERKAIAVDLAAQVFGAYEYGRLVRWGPVSSGDRSHQTPAGAYRLKLARACACQYGECNLGHALVFQLCKQPGTRSSPVCAARATRKSRLCSVVGHRCEVALNWGEGWTLAAGTRELVQPGTPVLLFGKYDYGADNHGLSRDGGLKV
jgi:hypothetical protein